MIENLDDANLISLADLPRFRNGYADDYDHEPPGEAAVAEPARPLPAATPFVWVDPATIPPRRWIYGKHYTRQFVSMTIAPGGVGKSSLVSAEVLAIATGRNILGVEPAERCPVWLVNLEDPLEELQRRIAATALHYRIDPRELAGNLFVNSGRDGSGRFVVAETSKGGATVVAPVVEAIRQQIAEHSIGLIVIDPFVSCHEVAENDNGAISVVMDAWRRIADETGCAVELVHHSRKTNGAEVTDEDGRGGSAQHGAARSMRALNRMSADEAERAGIENRRQFFRVTDGKLNLAPGTDKSTWFEIVGVDLGNGTDDRPGDYVGVVTSWQLPDSLDGVEVSHLRAVQKRVSEGAWRDSVQAADWVGNVVAAVLGLDVTHKAHQSRIKDLIKTWKATGMLKVVEREDENRKLRPFVEVGIWA